MHNRVQHYAWGDPDAIPRLVGLENPQRTPFAEYWMGAHPSASSEIETGSGRQRLVDLLQADPQRYVGAPSQRHFGAQLPFLFKILSAATSLSIQAHPDLSQAREGFAREVSAGVPLDAPQRNYRDDNHKPELIYALTPYWMVCGFRKISDIVVEFDRSELATLSGEVGRLARAPSADNLRRFFARILRLEGAEYNSLLQGGLAWAQRHGAGDHAEGWSHPRYWWVVQLARQFPNDIGALAPLYMNCFALQPGQALFLGSRILHAYLRGSGIELMANSDNVLRCGLTPKHIDPDELLRVLSFEGMTPQPMEPQPLNRQERVFHTPATEFRLSRIVLRDEDYRPMRRPTAEILLCSSGAARLTAHEAGADSTITIRKGQSLFVTASVQSYRMNGAAELFRATVGMNGVATQ